MPRKAARNAERFVLDFSGEIAFLCFEETLISVHNTTFAFSLYSGTNEDTDELTAYQRDQWFWSPKCKTRIITGKE